MEKEGKGPLQPALCRERLGAPRLSPVGTSGGRGDASLAGAGPSSHCAVGVTGRVCMQLVPPTSSTHGPARWTPSPSETRGL